MAARAVPAFYLHFIYCVIQFAVVANDLNMRIAIIPEENEKSEPFSNRKQVRIFLVWWARVSRRAALLKKPPLGLFCPAGRKRRAAAVRIHPQGCDFGFLQKKKTDVFSTLVFLVGAGGFEPPKLKAADLQSVPIGHSGTRPYSIVRSSLTACIYYHQRWSLSTLFLIFFSGRG